MASTGCHRKHIRTEQIYSQISPVLLFCFFPHLRVPIRYLPINLYKCYFSEALTCHFSPGSTCNQPTSPSNTHYWALPYILLFSLMRLLMANMHILSFLWPWLCVMLGSSLQLHLVCPELHHAVCQSVDILFLTETLGWGHPGSVFDKQENFVPWLDSTATKNYHLGSQAVGFGEWETSSVKWFAHILAWVCLLNQFVSEVKNSGSFLGKVTHIYLPKVSLWVSTKWQLPTQQQANVVWRRRSSTSNTDSWSERDLKAALQAIWEWQVI